MSTLVSNMEFLPGRGRLSVSARSGRSLASYIGAARGHWLLRLLFGLALVIQASVPALASQGGMHVTDSHGNRIELCLSGGVHPKDSSGQQHEHAGGRHLGCVLCHLSCEGTAPIGLNAGLAGVEIPLVASRVSFFSDHSIPLSRFHTANRSRAPPIFS